jgi:hypothetical protein
MENFFMETTDIIATLAIIVSIVSLVLTFIFDAKHYRNNLRPIPVIKINNYLNSLLIKIHNAGIGPLLIEELWYEKKQSEEEKLNNNEMLKEILKDNKPANKRIMFDNTAITEWAIEANSSMILFTIKPKDEEQRKILRERLSEYTIYLKYTDIYGTKFDPKKRELKFYNTSGAMKLKMKTKK